LYVLLCRPAFVCCCLFLFWPWCFLSFDFWCFECPLGMFHSFMCKYFCTSWLKNPPAIVPCESVLYICQESSVKNNLHNVFCLTEDDNNNIMECVNIGKPLHRTEPLLERNHAGHHCIKRQILFLWKWNLLQILSVLPLCRRYRFPGHYRDQAIYVVQFHQNYLAEVKLKTTRSHNCKRRIFKYIEVVERKNKSFQPIRGIRAIHRIETLDSKRVLIRN
jgi:hypothetical protein